MPPLVIPLIGLAVAGITSGMQIAGVGQPSTSMDPNAMSQDDTLKKQQEMLDKQRQQDNAKLTEQKKQMFQHAAPDAQAATGGALSDPAFAEMVASLTGNPGDNQLAMRTLFGSGGNMGDTSSGGASGGGMTKSPPGLTDILDRLRPGMAGGGGFADIPGLNPAERFMVTGADA